MTGFERDKPPARSESVSLRFTADDLQRVDAIVAALKLPSRVALLRKALDYFVSRDPEAKKAARGL